LQRQISFLWKIYRTTSTALAGIKHDVPRNLDKHAKRIQSEMKRIVGAERNKERSDRNVTPAISCHMETLVRGYAEYISVR